jgi:hypothetical protein
MCLFEHRSKIDVKILICRAANQDFFGGDGGLPPMITKKGRWIFLLEQG